MQQLNEFYYSWGPAVADINHDGSLDIVAGPYYYLGPDYTVAREIYLAQTIDPSTQYFNGLQYRIRLHRRWLGRRHQLALQPARGPLRQPERRIAPLEYVHRDRQDDQRDHAAEGHRRRRQAGVALQGQRQPDRLREARSGESDRHVDQTPHHRARAVGEPRHGRRRRQRRRPRRLSERIRLVGAAGERRRSTRCGPIIRRRSGAGPARARAAPRWRSTT